MSQHILYCNDTADVLVLDLPTSISLAQDSTNQLRSYPALQIPYDTPEPKGRKRKCLLDALEPSELEYHNQTQCTVQAALDFLHGQWHEPGWCRPRVYLDESELPRDLVCSSHDKGHCVTEAVLPPLILSPGPNRVCCPLASVNTVIHNPHSDSVDLVVSTQGRFSVPPRSTFLHASIDRGLEPFRNAVHCLSQGRLFDLILLDPPWSNRSVRKSRAYHTAENQRSDPFGEILPAITSYLSSKAYVAVWITNKAVIRSGVLSKCKEHGLVLEEEWIWLKITDRGEPFVPLEGIWRKPYEVLMLFRQTSTQQKVVRRVVLAVPDLHSRKPSLKFMFERVLPKDYNALELFARSLTAGWWSWGDEVLKFQHESCWC